MASWIGATPAQRFHQYTVPAAKKAVASNYKEVERVRIAALVRRFRADHAAAETPLARNRANRRIRAQIDEWRRVCDAWEADLDTIRRA